MKKPELLAPVGNMECLKAAINARCDAVYLGGYSFGARNYAGNFSNEELIDVIKYCHIYGVKVYVTVNTLIYESEVELFMNYIDFLHKNNVDALIIQDLGMVDLIRKTYPNLELHASTQMHIHNLEGVLFAEKIGIKRAVIARETDIETLKKIKNNSKIELEVFVQGALCISYSGQCLMSSLIGGRSGNRGTCTQCCRMQYDFYSNGKKLNKDKYLLSTKDLNTLKYIGDLIDIGISSLKIEGRMKRPEYVYLMVSLYRKAIDEYVKNKKIIYNDNIEFEMKKIFNREFTKGFLFNEKNSNILNTYRPNHKGIELGKVIGYSKNKIKIKLIEDLNKGDGIRILGKNDIGFMVDKIFIKNKKVEHAYKGDIVEIDVDESIKIDSLVLKTSDINSLNEINEKIKINKKINIIGKIICHKNEKIVFTISDKLNRITINSEDLIEESKNSGTTIEQIKKQICKTGGTPYVFEELEVECDDNIFIRISSLNKLRRDALEKLTEIRTYNIPYKKEEYNIILPDFKIENNTNIEISEEIKDVKNYNNIYVTNNNLYNNLNCENKILKLPRVINYYNDYNDLVLISEIGSLNRYKNFMTDFSFNVTNSYTVAFLHSLGAKRVTLSYELNDSQISDLIHGYHNRYNKHPNLELIVDSYPEAMVTKLKILDYYKVNAGYLSDKFKNKFNVIQNNDFSTIYHFKKIKLDKNKYFKMGINNVRIIMNNF